MGNKLTDCIVIYSSKFYVICGPPNSIPWLHYLR